MTIKEMKNSSPKRRLIARLGYSLVQHAQFVSVFLCLAGLLINLLLPLFAKNTYISENALLPGSASSRYSNQNAKEANDLIKEILRLKNKSQENHMVVHNLLFQRISDTGGDAYFHSFGVPDRTFNPTRFFIDPQEQQPGSFQKLARNNSTSGINVVGVVRAPRSDGKEAIVLVTPFRSDSLTLKDTLSLGVGYSLFSLFSQTVWLAKDVVWLAADSKHGAYGAVAAWLRDYHQPISHICSSLRSEESLNEHFPKASCYAYPNCDDPFKFQRAGTIAAALVIQFQENQLKTEKDKVNVYAEAINGQMPNLDLINVVNFLAVHRQGIQTNVELVFSILRLKWLNVLGSILEWLGTVSFKLNPDWKFGLPTKEYVHGAAVLASSIYRQALGIPTGAHGAFRDYQVDAITLEFSSQSSLGNEKSLTTFLLKQGRLIEGTVRSINNLLEKFHQSFFLYFLTSPGRFVSVGVYMIPFGLLVASLVTLSAGLSSYKSINVNTSGKSSDGSSVRESDISEVSHESESTESTKVSSSFENADQIKLGLGPQAWKWFDAAKIVVFVYLWALTVAMLPCFISCVSLESSEFKLLIWGTLSFIIVCLGHRILGFSHFIFSNQESNDGAQTKGWMALKAITLGATAIGFGIMSIVNYAAALVGSTLLVPMCLIAYPLKYIMKFGFTRKMVVLVLQISLITLAFPPFMVVLFRGIFDQFSKASLGEFWIWSESLWLWGSATYLYLFLVHLPCWVLCFYVVLCV